MNAIRSHRQGGPETLVYERAPRPAPGAREVLVEVNAAAITATELTWEPTWTSADGTSRLPIIPSHEISGLVAEVGPEVRSTAGPRNPAIALLLKAAQGADEIMRDAHREHVQQG